jgi:drug/metabolite transporter (DMT)-like permease
MGEFYALIVLCLFASNIVLTKLASQRVGVDIGFMLTMSMNVAFSLLLVAVQLAMRPDALQLRWDGVAFFALGGVFSSYLGRFFFFGSVVRFGPARASVFQLTGPVFTVLIAWVALDERLGWVRYVGIAITLAGLCLVVWRPGAMAQSAAVRAQRGGVLRWLAGSILVVGLGASLCYALGAVLRGVGMKRWDEPVVGALVAASAALLLHLATSRQAWRIVRDVRAADGKGVLMFLGVGVLTICAQTLMPCLSPC